MIGARTGPIAVLLAATVACSAAPERGYYAPVGSSFGDQLAGYSVKDDDVVIALACQGIYRNTVGDVPVRTIHLQMDATQTEAGDLVVPVADMRLDLLWQGSEHRQTLGVAEAWEGRVALTDALVVPAWSRRSFDLFFDHPDEELPPPDVVRVRWRYGAVGAWRYGDCQFQRIASADPRLPEDAPASDAEFGLRNGYYLPGVGDLGRRRLRPSEEARAHYLFHDPGGWIF